MDQAIQSEMGHLSAQDSSIGAVGDMVSHQAYTSNNEMQTDYSSEQSDNVITQDATVPMHLTAVSNNSHIDTSTSSEPQQFEDETDLDTTPVHIKQEPVDEIESIEISEETDMKPPEEEEQSGFSNQPVPSSVGSQIFVQPTVTKITRSPVPLSPKPYQCGVCHKAFRSVHVLQKHTQTFHTKPHLKLTPRRGRGRGSYYLNRPSHQIPQTSTFPVYPVASADQAPITSQQEDTSQAIPGTSSSQQMVQMAQMALDSQFPTDPPVAATPSTSDFTQSPSGPMFQSPSAGPSTSSPALQQGRVSTLLYFDFAKEIQQI